MTVLRLALAAAVAIVVTAVVAARMLTPHVARTASWNEVVCPASRAESPDAILVCGKSLYSQYDEELIIRDFFHDRRGGTFLDVGAAHYKNNSNTFYLEHHLGWSGDPVHAVAQNGPDYATYRPNTRFYSYLVTDHSGTSVPFYVLKTKYLMSTASKDWAEQFGHDDYETILKPTITLDDLLAKASVAKIDFVSMDIETGEPAALAGFDIERFKPALVCIEVTEGVRDRVATYFASHGYQRIARYQGYDTVNQYFTPGP